MHMIGDEKYLGRNKALRRVESPLTADAGAPDFVSGSTIGSASHVMNEASHSGEARVTPKEFQS